MAWVWNWFSLEKGVEFGKRGWVWKKGVRLNLITIKTYYSFWSGAWAGFKPGSLGLHGADSNHSAVPLRSASSYWEFFKFQDLTNLFHFISRCSATSKWLVGNHCTIVSIYSYFCSQAYVFRVLWQPHRGGTRTPLCATQWAKRR